MGPSSMDGAAATVSRLQALGKRIYLITNNSTRSHASIVDKAHKLHFNVCADDIITSATATATYLKKINFTRKVYVIGRPGIDIELAARGIRCTDKVHDEPKSAYFRDITWDSFELDADVGAVLINYDHTFSYGKLLKAINYLRNPKCLFLATGMDQFIPNGAGILIPGMSSIIKTIQELTPNRSVVVMGKPNKSICDPLFEDVAFNAKRTLVIGDSAETDILLGKNCGFQTLLVGSGIQKFEDIARWQNSDDADDKLNIPDFYLPKLSDLLPFL